MTDRAARWATMQVGKLGRSVNEIAETLGCDWHTVNDAVIAYGEALLDTDVDRVGDGDALGPGETLFNRTSRRRTQQWCTSVVNVGDPGRVAQLIDVVPGRSATRVLEWLDVQPEAWKQRIRYGVFGPVRPLPECVHRRARPRHPGRGPVPRGQARQLEAGRVPPPGADRDPRPPRPQRRPALPRPTAAREGT